MKTSVESYTTPVAFAAETGLTKGEVYRLIYAGVLPKIQGDKRTPILIHREKGLRALKRHRTALAVEAKARAKALTQASPEPTPLFDKAAHVREPEPEVPVESAPEPTPEPPFEPGQVVEPPAGIDPVYEALSKPEKMEYVKKLLRDHPELMAMSDYEVGARYRIPPATVRVAKKLVQGLKDPRVKVQPPTPGVYAHGDSIIVGFGY